MSQVTTIDAGLLPHNTRSRFIDDVNGLKVHILEGGFDPPGRPRVLLLHGFPELGYSWRKVMSPLIEAGFHVIAPDQRGYGRTTGWDPDYDGDLASFRILNLVRDATELVMSLGHSSVDAVVGHDFGSPVAAYCALARPDIFRSVALMSAPFEGPPSSSTGNPEIPDVYEMLAGLTRPRKHYQKYYCTRSADKDMRECDQGFNAFLRAYFHYKSADWEGNNPHPLSAWNAHELAKMPSYYIMDLDSGMAESVLPFTPSEDEIASCLWLTEEELQFYVQEFSRTGLQGGLQWYRCSFSEPQLMELQSYSGQTIDVPSCFIAGNKDWGVYQVPGAFERMQNVACTKMLSCDLVPGAGHWVQQEQSEAVVNILLRFLSAVARQ